MSLADLNRSNDTPIATLMLASITPRDWPTLPAVQPSAVPAYVPTITYFGGQAAIDPYTEGTANVTNDFNPKTQAAVAAQRGVSQVIDVTKQRGWLGPADPYVASPAAPTLASISPATAVHATPAITVTLTGTGFTPLSVALVDGISVPTTYVSATSLTISLTPPLLAAGTKSVGVIDHSLPAPVNRTFLAS